jgi:hypothetical protein
MTRTREIHELNRYGFNSRDTDKSDKIGGLDIDKNVWQELTCQSWVAVSSIPPKAVFIPTVSGAALIAGIGMTLCSMEGKFLPRRIYASCPVCPVLTHSRMI